MKPAFRTEIALLRKASGLQQKEVAAMLNRSLGHYQMVELGTRISQPIVDRVRAMLGKK